MILRRYIPQIVLLLLLALTGCSKEEGIVLPPADVDFIQTEKLTFEGEADGQQQTIRFTAPKAWVAEIHCLGDWLQVDVLKGDAGDAAITLTLRSDNTGATSRYASLYIFVDGYKLYEIAVEQHSATTSGLSVSGHVDEGVMTLASDKTGTLFADTIYVTSQQSWTLEVDEASRTMLSFSQTAVTTDGDDKCMRVVVYANYSQFIGKAFEGNFSVKAENGTTVPIKVKAEALACVYANARPLQGEAERVSYELVDTIQKGVFATTFYVDSNVRWHLEGLPSWIESAADWNDAGEGTNNVLANGNIDKDRCHVSLRVKTDEVSTEEKRCELNVVDDRGNVLNRITLSFAGLDNSYLAYQLIFPAADMMGNEWGFEAKKATVEESGPENRRRIAMPFLVTTAVNYKSMDDAPFHLLLVEAHNGMPHKTQVHWATLKMGDATVQETTTSGMFVKQLIIEANERGDDDDKTGLTNPAYQRYAFVYLVARDVTFEELWDGNNLKGEYADNLVLMTQKNDPNANYHFAFEGLADGARLSIASQGESRTFQIEEGSYDRCDIVVEQQDEQGAWVRAAESVCSLSVHFDDNGQPQSATFTFSKNESQKTPFGDIIPALPRHIRISVVAFLGDDNESRVIYTIYADQEAL